MTEHEQTPAAESAAHPDAPRHRLVIRAVILPDEPVPPVESWSIPRLLIAVVVLTILVLLGWMAYRSFAKPAGPVPQETMPNSQPVVVAPVEPGPVVAEPASSDEDGKLAPVEEVLPKPSRNALQTVRGTIRVSLRVGVDPQGNVMNVKSVDAGPSRYFERLSVDAAKQWKFSPSSSGEPRSASLRFSFTRDGVAARIEDQ